MNREKEERNNNYWWNGQKQIIKNSLKLFKLSHNCFWLPFEIISQKNIRFCYTYDQEWQFFVDGFVAAFYFYCFFFVPNTFYYDAQIDILPEYSMKLRKYKQNSSN